MEGRRHHRLLRWVRQDGEDVAADGRHTRAEHRAARRTRQGDGMDRGDEHAGYRQLGQDDQVSEFADAMAFASFSWDKAIMR